MGKLHGRSPRNMAITLPCHDIRSYSWICLVNPFNLMKFIFIVSLILQYDKIYNKSYIVGLS